MRKIFAFLTISLILILTACENDVSFDDYPVYDVTINNELNCVELNYNGIVYRPYGIFNNNSFRGNLIGVRSDRESDTDPYGKIYEVKGYDSNEWIADCSDGFMSGGDVLYKAVDITDIPEELQEFKEYD